MASPATASAYPTKEQNVRGIVTTIRRYFDGGRKGNAEEWCGQQSDRLLKQNFGGLRECLKSDIASEKDPRIPPGRELRFGKTININGNKAKARPKTRDGSTRYFIRLVFEGSNGGWAVDFIDNHAP